MKPYKRMILLPWLFYSFFLWAQQPIELSNSFIRLKWNKSADGWALTLCDARTDRGFASFGKPSGKYLIIRSQEKPDETAVPIIENGDTLKFPEKTFKYVYPKFQRAMSAVPMNRAGEHLEFYPGKARVNGKEIIFEEALKWGTCRISWKLDETCPTDLIVRISFTASADGYYALSSPTLSSISERELAWGVIPGYFQGDHIQKHLPLSYVYAQGLPAYPILCRESTITTMASLISHKNGLTMAIIPEPGQDRDPYEKDVQTHNSLWQIALSHMNIHSEITPVAYHPVLGERQSYLKKGETAGFNIRVSLQQADWYSVYKHAIYDVYKLKESLQLKETRLSLSRRLEMLYDYVLDDKTAMWNKEWYNDSYIAAQSYLSGVAGADKDAMKNSDIGAVWMLGKLTEDTLLTTYKLPYIRNFKVQQQETEGFFRGAARGQYYLAKKKIFTEEWGDHFEPVGLTYYTLMDIGNILLFEPDDHQLKTLLRAGADRLLEWQKPDGSWEVAFDKHTHTPLFTDLKDLRPTFYGLIVAYQLLKEDKYLRAAEKGAQWLIREGVNKGHFVGVCGDVRFVNDFATAQCAQALLDLYHITSKKAYLDASVSVARMYTTSIYTHPIPDRKPKIRKGRTLDDWQLSEVGLCFEHGGSMGSAVDNGPILLLSHCSMFLEMYRLTNDSLFLDMARAGALGRDAFVHPKTGVTSYYWKQFDHGAGSFPHHAWWQIGWIYDYLVSEAEVRTNGRIRFPRGFMTPKVGPHKSLGFAPGVINGIPTELILRKDLVQLDNPNVDYITAMSLNKDVLFVILLNNQDKVNTVHVKTGLTACDEVKLEPFGVEIITISQNEY